MKKTRHHVARLLIDRVDPHHDAAAEEGVRRLNDERRLAGIRRAEDVPARAVDRPAAGECVERRDSERLVDERSLDRPLRQDLVRRPNTVD